MSPSARPREPWLRRAREPPTRASDPGLAPWDLVDELVDEEDFSQALS